MKSTMKNFLKSIFLVATIAFVGCSKDEHNHNEDNHDHELEFSKVEFIFTEGHTHGSSFHGDPTYEGVTYLKSQQKVTFTLENGSWVASSTTPIRWRQSSFYGLEIVYYNANNERINSEILEESASHQHFFQFTDVTTIKTGTIPADVNSIASYKYRDTNPENQYYRSATATPNVKLLTDDPIGLKGYFEVKQNYLSFNLKISLAHFLSGNKLTNGTARAFNQLPSVSIAPADFQVSIPIRIYTDRLNESVTVQDMIDEFGITKEEAEADLDALLEGNVDPESSQVWM